MKSEYSRGFTLIEVILAISVLVMVFGVAYSSLSQIIRTKKILDDERDVTNVANAILVRLSREFQLAMPNLNILDINANPVGCIVSSQFIGNPSSGSRNEHEDSVTFIASSGGQFIPGGGAYGTTVQITYRVEDDPEASSNDAPKYLVRDEIPYQPHLRPCTKIYDKAVTFPLAKNLISLQFRYFDGDAKEWVSDWKTVPLSAGGTKRALPRMVRMTIKLLSPQGRVVSYSTVVPLRADN